MKTEHSGLIRPSMEKFLFEELSFNNVQECHKILYNVVIQKLKGKVDSPALINKAIQNE